MRKLYFLIGAAVISSGILSAQQTVNPNTSEEAPGINATNQNPTPQSPWQLLFNYDITAAGAGTGNAGVVVFGSEFWVSRWGSDTISNFTIAGTLISKFTVPGVTGTRSLTTDGTYIYAGTNTAAIYKIDPATKTLISTITCTGIPNVRYCAYDASLPGFWVGTWSTDFTLVDMTGLPTTSVLATSHALAACYGLALDNVTAGGPYLWAFNQTATNNLADLIQVNIATGLQTGVIHNVTGDFGTPADLAGGVHVVPAPLAIVGILQGSANYLFSYDLVGVNGVNENCLESDFVAVYPNPSNDRVNIQVKRENNDVMLMQLLDVTGRVVFESNNVGMNNYINISTFEAGIYLVKITGKDQVYTTQLVKN